jgi:hypothetical protein
MPWIDNCVCLSNRVSETYEGACQGVGVNFVFWRIEVEDKSINLATNF